MSGKNNEMEDWESVSENLTSSLGTFSMNEEARASSPAPSKLVAPRPSSQDGGSYSSPVSPVTAQATGSEKEIDPVLIACLENPRERMTLLQFEDRIIKFFRNKRDVQVTFQPLPSYHRLILHRLAERCRLERSSAEAPDSDNGMRSITLHKTPDSFLPTTLFIDLSAERQQSQQRQRISSRKVTIKQRAIKPNKGNKSSTPNRDSASQQKKLQDRERAYAEARARIFGESSPSSTPKNTADSTSKSSSNSTATKKEVSVQANGPDGTTGFSRGRGKELLQKRAHPKQAQVVGRSESDNNEAGKQLQFLDSEEHYESQRAEFRPQAQDAKNWKESKALLRNREEERNDPDFARNYDMYRRNYSPYRMEGGAPLMRASPQLMMANTGAYARPPPMPRMQTPPPPPNYYDPSAGQGYYPMGMHAHGHGFRPQANQHQPPPPPPPDYYGMPSQRAGYTNSNPHGYGRQQTNARPTADGSGNGAQVGYRNRNGTGNPNAPPRGASYNADFPPLN